MYFPAGSPISLSIPASDGIAVVDQDRIRIDEVVVFVKVNSAAARGPVGVHQIGTSIIIFDRSPIKPRSISPIEVPFSAVDLKKGTIGILPYALIGLRKVLALHIAVGLV